MLFCAQKIGKLGPNIIIEEMDYMRKIVLLIVYSFCFCGNVFASEVIIDADLNSVSAIYFQNITPSFSSSPVDTGLFLAEGDFFEVSAQGIWSNAPVSYNLIFGPGGNPNENITVGYPGAGYPVASLLGKIGEGEYFFIGSEFSGYAGGNGNLILGFNDTDYGNNWGTVLANINIQTAVVPEPLSCVLFLAGGIPLFAWRKKRK